MQTFPYNPMAEYNNILSPNIYDASSLSSALGTNGLSGLGQGGMSFSSTSNPLVNNLNNQITDGFSINNSVTPSWGSAFQSFRDGDVGLSDLGGMLGSRAKTMGSNLINSDFINENHNNLSAQNQFGNLWGGLQALTGMYSGFKQARLADKQFGMQRDAWNKSWDANKKQINEAVSTRAGLKFGDNTEKRAEYTKQYSV